MSDSSMNGAAGLVVGTAGHIDHGKTSLVRALTGMETDRLAEEKRRGISIDLGFAHLALPGGPRISFIDVPGHERFIRNMLAGAGGIEAVLLVVAADESVKPQTREHFDICRLLGIKRGLVVLTKTDLATPRQMGKTAQDVRALTAGSFLEGAPVIAVSSASGEGIAELKKCLAGLAAEPTRRDRTGLARLPIDRAFALKGFGTVVTGTLLSGTLRGGDIVQLHPGHREARIRGLQVHGNSVQSSSAGQRIAVNLAGIDHAEISRGFVLTHPGLLEPASSIDVAVDWLEGSAVPAKREQFLFHSGTTEILAGFKLLASNSPFARLSFAAPVLTLPGDRFVLRRPSPALTVAGGTVLESFPPKRLNRAKTLQRLHRLYGGPLHQRIELLVAEGSSGQRMADLIKSTGVPATALEGAIKRNPQLSLVDNGQHVVARKWIEQRREKLLEWLKAFHARNPAAAGAPVSQARLGLTPALAAAVFDNFPAVLLQGGVVALAHHQAKLSDQESQALLRIEQAFRSAGYQPPATDEILRSAGADPSKSRGMLEALIKSGRLVRVSADLIFHADAIAHIRDSLAVHKGKRFSVPEFKSWTNISRKYAIPLLEYLDRQHVTRRDGDMRSVL